jgi:hypothetical protein
MAWDLPPLPGIPVIYEQILQGMTFFTNNSVLNTFNIPEMKISWNYSTFIGFQNYITIIINEDTLLVPVNAILGLYL